MAFSEIEIELQHLQLTIRGLRYCAGNPDSNADNPRKRVLCLHGWLDNANSFQPLMPLLDNCDAVALDLPGHGLSDHSTDPYTIANNAHCVLQVARELGWDTFHLIGHSMGGGIAPFTAAASPGSIESMVLIDAAGPITETAEQLPERLIKFHQDLSKYQSYQSRTFKSPDQAIQSRLTATKMNESSARLIIDRQLLETDDGFQWRFDGKLRVASASYFTEQQVRAVLSAVPCPVLCILADDGYLIHREKLQDRLNSIGHLEMATLSGHHHLHMDHPDVVATCINTFLSSISNHSVTT